MTSNVERATTARRIGRRLLGRFEMRVARRPSLAAHLLMAARKLPPGRMRAAAYAGFSRPLAARLSVPVKVAVTGGSWMEVDTTEAMGRTLAVSGVWEPNVTPVFRRLLSPGDVCLDVGAGIGYYTLLAAKLVGAGGHVYALEPAPSLYAALQRNLALNAASNVTALAVAAGAEDGRALLYEAPRRNLGQSSTRRAHDSGLAVGVGSAEEVRVRRTASIVQQVEPTRIRLIKIDVEGAEVGVLEGLEPLIERGCRPSLIVELHPRFWREEEAALFTGFCRRHSLRLYELVDEHRPGYPLAEPRRAPFEPEELAEREGVTRALLDLGQSATGCS